MDTPESLFTFPCQFPIKVVGSQADDFAALVVEIVARRVGTLEPGAVTQRMSKTGKYLAVTVTVEAQSKEQLDLVYQDLSAHKRIIMAL